MGAHIVPTLRRGVFPIVPTPERGNDVSPHPFFGKFRLDLLEGVRY